MSFRKGHSFSSQDTGALGAFSSIYDDGLFSHWTHSVEHEGEVDGTSVGLDVGSSVGLGVGTFDGVKLFGSSKRCMYETMGENDKGVR